MEFYQVYEKSNSFEEKIYQLQNFHMIFKCCHLAIFGNVVCVNVVILPLGRTNDIAYNIYGKVW